MPNKTVQHWIAWLNDARALRLNEAADALNLSEFIVSQEQRIAMLGKEVRAAQDQCNVWRLLAAERLEQIKNFQQGESKNGI